MNAVPDPRPAPSRSLIDYAHWIYALHALAVLLALLSARSIALRFAFSLPSVLAIIMNYLRRSEARGTWLQSHFRWQIRTFWFAWLWIAVTSVVSMPLLIVGIGFLTAPLGLGITGLWVSYRVVRGWLALRDGVEVPVGAR